MDNDPGFPRRSFPRRHPRETPRSLHLPCQARGSALGSGARQRGPSSWAMETLPACPCCGHAASQHGLCANCKARLHLCHSGYTHTHTHTHTESGRVSLLKASCTLPPSLSTSPSSSAYRQPVSLSSASLPPTHFPTHSPWAPAPPGSCQDAQ